MKTANFVVFLICSAMAFIIWFKLIDDGTWQPLAGIVGFIIMINLTIWYGEEA